MLSSRPPSGHTAPSLDFDSFIDNVPIELLETPAWVVWRYEDHGRPKRAKVPYTPTTHRRADSTDPSTWATFAEAAAACQRSGFDGVGFVFSKDDPYMGVDLDGCRNPETGHLEPWAGEIVERLSSYTEASPSGTGVHIVVRGTVPAGRNKAGVEMYDRDRYFTVTGEHVGGTPCEIEDRSAEVLALYRAVFGDTVNGNGHPAPEEIPNALPPVDVDPLKVSRFIKALIRCGPAVDPGKYPSRSEAVFAAITALIQAGYETPLIASLLLDPQNVLSEKPRQQGRHWLAQEIARARAKGIERPEAPWPTDDDTPPEVNGPDTEPHLDEQRRSDEAENARILAEEREAVEEKTQLYPCPQILWQGIFGEVAQRMGLRSWEVWTGTYAGVSATAQRNLHWFYFNDPIFGMSYPLLLGPTGAGKNLVTNICQDLLPDGYPVFYSIQSGPGLIPLLTDVSLKNKEGRLTVRGRPVLLLAEEWSRTIQMAGIEHATLLEDLNALFQRARPWSMSRSHKLPSGGSITIIDPALTICGTSTIKLFSTCLSDKLIYSGYLNRHLILPGQALWEEFTGQMHSTTPLQGLLEPLKNYAWGCGRNLREAYSPGAWERWLDLQRHFFLPLVNAPDLADTAEVFKRLHFYFHHVALVYAWSERSSLIEMPHLQAAEQVISTSHQFLLRLLETQHAHVEPPTFQRRAMGIEQRILAKVTREPGIPKRKLMQDLNRTAGCEELGRCLDSLLKAGLLTSKSGPRKQVLLFPPREKK